MIRLVLTIVSLSCAWAIHGSATTPAKPPVKMPASNVVLLGSWTGAPCGASRTWNGTSPADFRAYTVDTRAGTAYAGGSWAQGPLPGVSIVDVADPANPCLLGFLPTAPPSITAEVTAFGTSHGDRLLFYCGDIVDLASPSTPFVVGTVTGCVGDANTDHVFVTDGRTLTVFDASIPSAPIELGSYASSLDEDAYVTHAYVAVFGDYAYLAERFQMVHHNGETIRIVDVSDPANPSFVQTIYSEGGQFATTANAMGGFAVSGDYLYLTTFVDGILIYNVATPGAAVLVSSYPPVDGNAIDIVIEGSTAFVAALEGGLRVLDLSDPVSPMEVGFYDTVDDALGVAYRGGIIHLAAAGEGLHLLEFTPPTVPTFIRGFVATPAANGIGLRWEIQSNEDVREFELARRDANGDARSTVIASTQRVYVDEGVVAERTYSYRLAVVLGDGSRVLSPKVSARFARPAAALHQNLPNPFNPATTISFVLGEAGYAAVTVYDANGRRIRTLASGRYSAGMTRIDWDGRDNKGASVASGIYFYQLRTRDQVMTRKMSLLK